MKRFKIFFLTLILILFVSMPVNAEGEIVVIEGEVADEVLEQQLDLPLNEEELPMETNYEISVDGEGIEEPELTNEISDLSNEKVEENTTLDLENNKKESLEEEPIDEGIVEIAYENSLEEKDLPVEEESVLDSEVSDVENLEVKEDSEILTEGEISDSEVVSEDNPKVNEETLGKDEEVSEELETVEALEPEADEQAETLENGEKNQTLEALQVDTPEDSISITLDTEHFISEEEMLKYVNSLGEDFSPEEIREFINQTFFYVESLSSGETYELGTEIQLSPGESIYISSEYSPIWQALPVRLRVTNVDGKINYEFVEVLYNEGEDDPTITPVEQPKFDYFKVDGKDSVPYYFDQESNKLILYNFANVSHIPMEGIATFDEVKYEFDINELLQIFDGFTEEDIRNLIIEGDPSNIDPDLAAKLLKYELILNGSYHGFYLEDDKSVSFSLPNLICDEHPVSGLNTSSYPYLLGLYEYIYRENIIKNYTYYRDNGKWLDETYNWDPTPEYVDSEIKYSEDYLEKFPNNFYDMIAKDFLGSQLSDLGMENPWEYLDNLNSKFLPFIHPQTKGAQYSLKSEDGKIEIKGEKYYYIESFSQNIQKLFGDRPNPIPQSYLYSESELETIYNELKEEMGLDYAGNFIDTIKTYAGTRYVFPLLYPGEYKLVQTVKPENTDFTKYGLKPLEKIVGPFIKRDDYFIVKINSPYDEGENYYTMYKSNGEELPILAYKNTVFDSLLSDEDLILNPNGQFASPEDYFEFIRCIEKFEPNVYIGLFQPRAPKTTPSIQVGDLIISKIVIGGSDDEEFTFKLTLTDRNGEELVNTFDYLKYHLEELIEEGFIKSGETFVLKNGQTIRVKNIPYTTKYIVEELTTDGYVVVAENEMGQINSEETFVVFTNIKEEPFEEPYDFEDTPVISPEVPMEVPEIPLTPSTPVLPEEAPKVPEVPRVPMRPGEAPRTFDSGIGYFLIIGILSFVVIAFLEKRVKAK